MRNGLEFCQTTKLDVSIKHQSVSVGYTVTEQPDFDVKK